MQIKEVEERTHLSSKTIRFYEDKGLLNVKRSSSGYRDYDEEDIQILLQIKLYRKCGLSLQEIKDIFDQKINLDDLLYQKISEYDKKDLELSSQKELCLEVIKAKNDYQELYETIDVLDSDDYHEFVDSLMNMTNHSLAQQIILTIIALGPLLNSFLMLSLKQYDRLWLGILLTMIMTVCMTLSWRNFLKDYRFQRETLWQGIKHVFGMLIVLILGIVIMLLPVFGFSIIQAFLFLRGDAFSVSVNRIGGLLLLFISLEIFLILFSYFGAKMKHQDYHQYDFVLPFVKRHKRMILFINIVILYISFMNVTVFTTNEMISYTPFNPIGNVYQYEDVQEVKTGFYKHKVFFLHEKGDFYYEMIMKDGTKLSISDTQTIEQYEEDTYSDYVVIDELVMKHHPLKIGNTENSEYIMMDQIYIDRFKSIVNNK